jgi:hypothetical protein
LAPDLFRRRTQSEDRVDRGQLHLIRLRISDGDGAGAAVDMAPQGLRIAHQFDRRRVGLMNSGEVTLFEIAVDPNEWASTSEIRFLPTVA